MEGGSAQVGSGGGGRRRKIPCSLPRTKLTPAGTQLSSPEPSTPPSDGPVPSAAYLSLLARLEAFARPIELWALPGTPGHRKIKDEDPDSSSLPSLSPSSSRDSSPTFSELSCPTLPYSTPAFEQPFASSSTPRNGSSFAGSLLRVKRGHAGGREEEESPLRGKGKRVRSKGRMRTSRRTRCSRSEKG